jgi:hypothetical protein
MKVLECVICTLARHQRNARCLHSLPEYCAAIWIYVQYRQP